MRPTGMTLPVDASAPHLTPLLALAGVGIWHFDHEVQQLSASPEVVAWLTGNHPPDRITPLTLGDVEGGIHPDDWATVRHLVCPLITGQVSAPVRLRVRGRHGHWVWLEGKSQVLRSNAQGQPSMTHGVLLSVNEQVIAEQHLRLQQAFSDVVSQSPDRATLQTAMLKTVLGLQELDGGGLYQREANGDLKLVIHDGLEPDFVRRVAHLPADSPQAQWVQRGDMLWNGTDAPEPGDPQSPPGPDGRSLPTDGFSMLVVLPIHVNGQVQACLNLASTQVRWLPAATRATLQDLAVRFGLALERLQAREELQAQRQHLQTVLDNFPFLVWMKDLQGRFLAVNAPFANACGAPHGSAVVGKTDFDVWPDHLAQDYRTDDQEVLVSGQSKQVVERVNTPEGEVWMETYKSPVIVDGRLTGTVGFARDISDRQRMEAELEREHSLLKSLVDALPDLFWVKDPEGVYLACNRRFESLYGRSAADIIGKTDRDFVDETMADFFRQHDLAAMAKGGPSMNEELLRFASDGHEELTETIKTPVLDSNAKVLGVMGIGRDITQRAKAQAERAELLERLQKIARHVPGLVYQYHLRPDGSACIPYASPGIRDVFGTSPEAVADDASAVLSAIHPDDAPQVVEAILASARSLSPWVLDFRVQIPAGPLIWVRGHSTPERLDDGGTLWHGYARDVTEERSAREQLLLSASAFQHSYDGIMVTDAANTIVKVNPAFTRITGYSAQEVMGRSPSMLSSGRQGPAFYQAMWQSLQQHGHWSGEVWNRRKDGELCAEVLSIAVVRDDAGNSTHYLGVFSDITRLKTHEAELTRIAQYDALTGVPNRRLLGDRMKLALARARRQRHTLAVCMLDLDGFKAVNDDLGHAVGDELLVTVAQRLGQALREGDTLARLGGDEFVLLLADLTHPEQSHQVLDRVLHSVAQPLSFQGQTVSVTASVGVTLFPADDADADTLLRHADQAMYEAKQSGRNRYQFFDAVQDRLLMVHREQWLRLERGLAQDELVLHYQPKVNLRTGEVLGAEALIRWQHPQRGLLAPADFLHLARGSQLELTLGQWVLRTALAQVTQWQQQHRLNLPVSINVGALQLLDAGFLGELRHALDNHPQVQPDHVELEILESAAIEDMGRATQVLAGCQRLGVQLALDDFGTGYSSLAYFRQLPVNTIKIDQSFVRDMLHDPSDLGIVDSVIRLADAFSRPVIAEGVETLEHGSVLLILGCEQAQGHGISPPLAADLIPGWVAEWKCNQPWTRMPSVSVSRDKLALLAAKRSHQAWLERLRDHWQQGLENPDSGAHCLFGQWYDNGGAARFGRTPGFESIGPLHDRVHTLARELWVSHPRAQPQGLPAELLAASEALLQALDRLIAS